jgi:hypothetical protein
MIVTSSSLAAFLSCPRKYRYSYVELLRSRVEAEALRLGTLWHLAMESWWQRRDYASAAHHFDAAEPFMRAKLRAMLAGYHSRWADVDAETVVLEQQFAVMLSGAVMLRGKVDGIIKVGSRHMLLEHKTTSDDITTGADYWQRLSIDLQVSAYHLGAAAIGYDVAGCVYDVARKPLLRPLQPTKKRAEPETAEEYEGRCCNAMTPDSYAQAVVVRLESEIEAARVDMLATAAMISDRAANGEWPRNSRACHEYSRCPYWGLCTGTADESAFIRVDTQHQELEAECK